MDISGSVSVYMNLAPNFELTFLPFGGSFTKIFVY